MYIEFYSYPLEAGREEAVIRDATEPRGRDQTGREKKTDAAAARRDEAGRIPYEDIN